MRTPMHPQAPLLDQALIKMTALEMRVERAVEANDRHTIVALVAQQVQLERAYEHATGVAPENQYGPHAWSTPAR